MISNFAFEPSGATALTRHSLIQQLLSMIINEHHFDTRKELFYLLALITSKADKTAEFFRLIVNRQTIDALANAIEENEQFALSVLQIIFELFEFGEKFRE